MPQAYSGSCMCGAAKFIFIGAPKFVKDCVCHSCRRAHGASAVCWVGVDNAQFQLVGDTSVRWYASSDQSERGFCVECGTRFLFRSSIWPGETHMSLACVNTPHDLLSTGLSFKEELPKWSALQLVPEDEARIGES